jgi:shikimate kinase
MVKSTSENAPQNKHGKNPGRLKKRSGKPASAQAGMRVQPKRPLRMGRNRRLGAVFLVGFMGAGKTSVGRALGQRLNWIFEDLDDRIAAREGRTVAEIFRDSGENEFRRAEHNALKHLLDELRGGSTRIVALGGGAFVQPDNASLLETSEVPTVFLDAPVEDLWQRCSRQANEDGTERPLLRSQEQFRKLYESRRPAYAKAVFRIEAGNRSVEETAAEITKMLGLKKIEVRNQQGETE